MIMVGDCSAPAPLSGLRFVKREVSAGQERGAAVQLNPARWLSAKKIGYW